MLGSRIELLLVDDDEIDRELVCRLLSSEYAVSEAATAEEALAAVERYRPDCVLLDYRLPTWMVSRCCRCSRVPTCQ